MRSPVIHSLVVPFLLVAATAQAHSVKQELGRYEDTEGRTRQRASFGLNADVPNYGPQMSAASLAVNVTRDATVENDPEDENLILNGVNQAWSLTATQTWQKITDTRVLSSFSQTGESTARTYGAGASQWLFHESLRLDFDVSRTMIDRPPAAYLDYDSEEVLLPSVVTNTGFSVGVRHLATPTTIMDYTASEVVSEDRPPAYTGGVAGRQFIPPTKSAIHVSVARSYNRGAISRNTSYGQVDAWIGEAAFLQEMWSGAHSRVGYRQYREIEVTKSKPRDRWDIQSKFFRPRE